MNAVRQPINNSATATPVAPTSASTEPITVESLGWTLRAALPPLRLHSVSIYDEEANVLWLSEGALGPDEHNVVVESIEALTGDTSLPCYETGIEDGRVALSLPIRAPHGGLVGLAMVLADVKSVGDGVLERMVTPSTRAILQRLAVLLKPTQPAQPARAAQGASASSSAAGSDEAALQLLEMGPVAAAALSAPVAKAPVVVAAKSAAGAKPAAPAVLTPQAVDDILEFELTPDLPEPVSHITTQRIPPSIAPVAPPAKSAAAAAIPAVKIPTPPAAPMAAKVATTQTLRALNVASAAPAIAPTPAVASKITAVPFDSLSFANSMDAFDLHLPALDKTSSADKSGSNVTPFRAVTDDDLDDLSIPDPSSIPVASAAPAATPAPAAESTTASAASTAPAVSTSAPVVEATAAPAQATATVVNLNATSSNKALSPAATGTSKSLSATSTSRVLQVPEASTVILEVQPFSKLRTSGRTRRFEVLARSAQPNRTPAGFDKIALQQLLAWMSANRAAWSLEPTSFTLNLSIATLEDERFPQFVSSNLKSHGIAPDNIGFEIAEPLCLQRRAQVERFITLCDKLGCFVVIDDFSLDSSITGLLRSKALRLVKIDPRLTSVALKDKLSQAMVVAICQAVKVLGIHCSAKRVDTQASLQWLTSMGCDFAQGAALAQLQPLESLGLQPATPPAPPAAG